ncbi:aminoglycoside phosphotransferase family protein [Bacillus paralicheniformis]|uniref:aminoglycoside phosphotransferase family protein n=1 Tax=Bacillus paralicheniformis TaxID=1648923 RepID=UPI00398244E7
MFSLKKILKGHYGIDSVNISPEQGGWTALAYQVTDGKAAFFLKVYDKNRASTAKWTALIDDYMPVLRWLSDRTALSGKLPVPLLTTNGEYKCEDDDAVYVLYEYIAGETIGGRPLGKGCEEKIASIIAELHRYDETIPVKTERIKENYDISFLGEMKQWLDHLPCELAPLIQPYIGSIREMMEAALSLADDLKCSDRRLALCHTDIHGWNMMKTGGELILIDWEGLKLAPVEADLMFFANQPYVQEFLRVYRETHKGFEIDQNALRFYQIRRRLEDIWEFTEQLAFDIQTEKEKAETLSLLKNELEAIEDSKIDC